MTTVDLRTDATKRAAPAWLDRVRPWQGLPSVQAVYTWVRLAQRVPVRVALDHVPDGVVLSAGMTATIIATPKDRGTGTLWTRVAGRFEGLLPKR